MANLSNTAWQAISAISTVVLAIAAICFGERQYLISREQNRISNLLVNQQIRAILELSFEENQEWITFTNIGQVTATNITVNYQKQGGGYDKSFVAPQDDIHPNESFRIMIGKPEIIENGKGHIALNVFLKYSSEGISPIERRFSFVDHNIRWMKVQWH